MSAPESYSSQLAEEFGGGWNRFWFRTAPVVPLARIRIATGILAALYFLTWAPNLSRWLSANGLLPPDAVRELLSIDNRLLYRFSPLYLVGDQAALWVVLALAILASLLLTLGLFSRISSLLTLVAVLSFVHRAPMLTGPLETYLAMLLLYLTLGPAGAAMSVDAWLARKRGKPLATETWLANVALRLTQLHTAALIALTACAMFASGAWWDGTAIWFLAGQTISRPFDLSGIRGAPKMVNLWTHLFVAINVVFPVLVWYRLLRPIVLVVAGVLWLSMIIPTGHILYIAAVLTAMSAFVGSRSKP